MGLAIVALYILFFESLFIVKNKDVKDALYGVLAVGIASSLTVITFEVRFPHSVVITIKLMNTL